MDDYAYSPVPVMQFLDDDGKPLVGGFLCTFLAGTDTPEPTMDSDGKANEVRVKLDMRGETPTAILLDSAKAYKFRLLRSDGTQVWERDGIRASGLCLDGNIVTGLAAEAPVTVTTEGSKLVIGFDSSGIDSALATERSERAAADESLQAALDKETAERESSDKAEADARAAKDSELEGSISGKQDRLTAGDNISIVSNVIGVTGRKRLAVKSPLTSETSGDSLVLGMSTGVYATVSGLEAETAARESADSELSAAIATEAAERNSAYDSLQQALDSEILSRQTGDENLHTLVENLSETKQDRLTFDDTPTLDSQNPVTSDGIRRAINLEGVARAAAVSSLSGTIASKQDKLTAGDGITITDNVISATGSEWVRLDLSALPNDQDDSFPVVVCGGLTVYAYSDSAAAVRLYCKATDEREHYVYLNGGGSYVQPGGGCYAISTGFTQSSPRLVMHLYDCTDSVFHQYEIYAFTSSGTLFDNCMLVRKLSGQTIDKEG